MPDDLKDLQKAVRQFQVEQRRPRTIDWIILLGRLTRLVTALGALILVGVAVSVIWPHVGQIRTAADSLLHPRAPAPTSQPAARSFPQNASASSPASHPPPARQATAVAPGRPGVPVAPHRIGDVFTVGTWEYSVSAAAWQDLYKPAVDKTVWPAPGQEFLVVFLTVCNIGDDAALLPPARLVGPDGAKYDARFTSGEGPAIEDSLMPERHYKRQIAFDLPPGKSYKLILSGGWLSDKRATVEMSQ